jgi:hypothetical protein
MTQAELLFCLRFLGHDTRSIEGEGDFIPDSPEAHWDVLVRPQMNGKTM